VSRQMFTLEVTRQRPMAQLIVPKGDVAVSGEGTGEHGDVTEDGFEGFVEDVCES
jgi:hypothetical protein